jgi:hypothetical protein
MKNSAAWGSYLAQGLLYGPPRSTLKNSTFFPHSIFITFVRISEEQKTANIYLNSITLMVCTARHELNI